MSVISVSGLIGSGKDSVAEYLITAQGYKRLSYASSLKDAVASIFGWDRTLLEGLTKESREWRDQIDPWWSARLDIPHLTPRWILQQWGTEVCRVHFHMDIWVASVENTLRTCTDNIVITDARFKNELQSIKNSNGTTIRVHRGPEPEWHEDAVIFNRGPYDNPNWEAAKTMLDFYKVHASEYSSVGLDYDYYIQNDGTLVDLYDSIENIINQL